VGKKAFVPVALAGIAATAAFGWAIAARHDGAPDPGASAVEPPPIVEIVAPQRPLDIPRDDAEPDEECKTGCSLQTHHIPPFSDEQFVQALADYARQPPDQVSQPLETLLFYGARTRELIDLHGTPGLPEQHAEFLDRQLARDHAQVWVRFVEEGTNRVRVSVGPTRVPIGRKMHLHPDVLTDVQSLEINGTVMRVGLYHLWSRY
jgi:hypothetical protein